MTYSAIIVALIIGLVGAWMLLCSFKAGGENVPADPAPADDGLCSICHSDIAQPHTLQCGHVFCEACLGEWISNRASRGLFGSCPLCRDQVLPDIRFYPNRCSTGRVRVDGVDACTTHDINARNHDQRHLLDRAFVEALPSGEPLLAGLVPPTPPCGQFVTGTDAPEPGSRILGMLARPLTVNLSVPASSGSSGIFARSVELKLGGALVVEHLPVQMHMSVTSLRRTVDASTLDLIDSALGTMSAETLLNKEKFPGHYHAHPYWNPNVIRLGSAAFVGGEEYGAAVRTVGQRLQRAGVQDTARQPWTCVHS